MFMIRWRKRLLACALFCVMALVLLVSTQHRLRLAVIKIIPSTSASELNSAPEQLHSFSFYPVRSPGASFRDAMQLFEQYTVAYHPIEAYALPMSEEPATCLAAVEEHRPIHCYNVDIAYTLLFGANGYYTRMWDLNGANGLGGNGHNLLELWDDASQQWKAVDPYYHCYYARGDSAIGVAELRRALLTNDTTLRVISYADHARIFDSTTHQYRAPIYPAPKQLLADLRMLAPAAMVHLNNDFVTRYAHRYGALEFLAPLFDKLSLKDRRGLRSLMLGSDDARYMIQDQFTPNYHATTIYLLARALSVLALLFVLLFAVGLWLARRARVVVVRQQEQPPVLA
jgi:hypothetical protein